MKTTWRKLITKAMARNGETWDDVEDWALPEGGWDREFDDDYGRTEGKPFTLWTARRVYFPVTYDGCEWVESVPRNPCSEFTAHIGGE